MDRIIIVSVFVFIAFIGFFSLYQDLKRYRNKIDFANEFLDEFRKLFKNQEIDFQVYTWLVHRSPKLQDEMGGYGIAQSFRPPYSNFMYNNYPIILNLIPKIRREVAGDTFTRSSAEITNEYMALVSETLIRYIGSLDDSLDEFHREIKNPIIWLRKGFSWILLLPISILYWLGIVSHSLVERIPENPIFKIIAGFVALVGSISTIMGVVMGWDSFVETATNLFAQIFR